MYKFIFFNLFPKLNCILKLKKNVAICIPTYNSLRSLISLLKSLSKCNLAEVDIYVFDDFSCDGTSDYIKSFHGFEVNLVLAEKNIGFVGNINRCLKLCQNYEWICIVHHDDIVNHDVLNYVLHQLPSYPYVGIIFSSTLIRKVDNQFACKLYTEGPVSVNKVLKSQLAPSGIFYNAVAIQNCGFYNLNFPYSADEEYHSRIAQRFCLLEVSGQIAGMIIHGRNYRFLTWEKADFLDNYLEMRKLMLSYGKRNVSSIEINKERLYVCYAICVELITFKKIQLCFNYYKAGIKVLGLNMLSIRFILLFFFVFNPNVFINLKKLKKKF